VRLSAMKKSDELFAQGRLFVWCFFLVGSLGCTRFGYAHLSCASGALSLDATEAVGLHWFARDYDGEGRKSRDEAAALFFDSETGIAEFLSILTCEFVV